MISREQVKDLQPGDVVELECHEQPGTVITGPLHAVGNRLQVGTYIIRTEEGGQFFPFQAERTLTVVSRAPRPLYVNHPRTEPVPGDVVRDADKAEWNGWLYLRSNNDRWLDSSRGEWFEKAMPTHLRLLVDGETGQVVP